MISIAKRFLPFIIALLLGVALAGAFNALRFEPCSKRKSAPIAPGALSAPACPSMAAFGADLPVRIRLTLDDAVEEIKRRTRQFAKRQMTWFRPDSRIRWFDAMAESDFEAFAEVIAREALRPG